MANLQGSLSNWQNFEYTLANLGKYCRKWNIELITWVGVWSYWSLLKSEVRGLNSVIGKLCFYRTEKVLPNTFNCFDIFGCELRYFGIRSNRGFPHLLNCYKVVKQLGMRAYGVYVFVVRGSSHVIGVNLSVFTLSNAVHWLHFSCLYYGD